MAHEWQSGVTMSLNMDAVNPKRPGKTTWYYNNNNNNNNNKHQLQKEQQQQRVAVLN